MQPNALDSPKEPGMDRTRFEIREQSQNSQKQCEEDISQLTASKFILHKIAQCHLIDSFLSGAFF